MRDQDPLDRAKRSALMSRIRGANTAPERRIRSALHRHGYRFRLHSATLPGRPDIVLPKFRTVIFVHGCFWHRHSHCKYATVPHTNCLFWRTKFRKNVSRDRRVQRALRAHGWTVIVVWECHVKSFNRLTTRVRRLVALLQTRLKASGARRRTH